ncbi:MAG TPA: VIT and VWA domain-containing protein [Bryobacteraceae bacterium]|nr:VIT and VWA domain-containing protein [Bryobacteraceae bacterium]
MRTKAAILLAATSAAGLLALFSARPVAAKTVTSGSLTSIDPRGDPLGACPLKHTSVKAEISGPLSRVTVAQEFQNPYRDKIEAVYTFPLPHDAAVDDMTMLVGDRVVRGKIKRREEARAIYESARKAGKVAGLLDQERPNIFTQAVANIAPGATVKITISYVETMEYEDGAYQFTFPMVVGPRYVPAGTDASRITPPVTPPGTRAGHDISMEIALDAGVSIDAVASSSHEVEIARPDARRAVVKLKDQATIPNKDFLLRYDVAGRRVEDAVLTHYGARGGFFTLLLQPPERVPVAEITPKELVFVLDTSGSMMGFPIEKAKETMRLALDGLHPRDTFNLITFSGDTQVLFPAPVAATAENLARAQEFLASRSGSGGTEMMKAIRAALEGPDTGRVRVVCFMTDGHVGNDQEIIREVQNHQRARVFSFGIGNSVNRYLLDNMARYGRGEVEYVMLNQDGSAAARRFHERVQSPLLTDISIDWGGLPVADTLPQRIPDLFAAKPLVISGRYTGPASGVVRLRGRMAGREFSREIRVNLPAAEPRHDVLASLWARRRIGELMANAGDRKEEITQLGLDYRLMTQFTSFVAVEETTVIEGGEPRRVEVPVEMPEGMSYEGVFGSESQPAMAMRFRGAAMGGGVAGGIMATSEMAVQRKTVYDRAVPAPAPNPLQVKLAPSLIRLYEAARGSANPGKVRVQVYLADTSAATLAALQKLGFEITARPKTGTIVTGRIAADKLKALAEMPAVRYCAPFDGR